MLTTEHTGPLPDDLNVFVCSACLQVSCWQGVFYCDNYRSASVVKKPVRLLRSLRREHESYWEMDYNVQRWREMC